MPNDTQQIPTITRLTHSFRVDAETHAMLATMARTRGVTQASLLAQLAHQEFGVLIHAAKPMPNCKGEESLA
jgi:hypothetical protein